MAKRRVNLPTAVIALLLIVGMAAYSYFFIIEMPQPIEVEPVEGDLLVYIFDVGQADCTLICSEDGNILIDAGDKGTQDEIVDMILATGVEELEYVIFTHPDRDHIGGADEVIDGITVENVILPVLYEEPDSIVYEEMMNAIGAKERDGELVRIDAVSGTVYDMGDLKMKVLAPNAEKYSNINDYSVAVRLDYGESSFLFTGDALERSEKQMLETYSVLELDCDFFQAGHHGAANANTLAFVQAVSPEIVAVSCGAGNKYGHPTQTALENYAAVGADVYRTDKLGTIIFVSDGKEITVK